MSTKQQRLAIANSFLRVMGRHGRRFFYNKEHDRYAELQLDGRGRIWLIDEYKGARIYTHYPHHWRGFSNGGTCRSIVQLLCRFIQKGTPIGRRVVCWPEWYCDGDLWGYGHSQMACVRAAANRMGILGGAA